MAYKNLDKKSGISLQAHADTTDNFDLRFFLSSIIYKR